MSQTTFTSSHFLGGLVLLGVLGVLTSKQILLLNEETLVAIAFAGFVAVAYRYGGGLIDGALRARSEAIQVELSQYLNLQEEVLEALVREHQAHTVVTEVLKDLGVFASEAMGEMASARQVQLQHHLAGQVQQRLRTLAGLEGSLVRALQAAVVAGFRGAVCEEFRRMDPTQRRELVRSAIASLNAG